METEFIDCQYKIFIFDTVFIKSNSTFSLSTWTALAFFHQEKKKKKKNQQP